MLCALVWPHASARSCDPRPKPRPAALQSQHPALPPPYLRYQSMLQHTSKPSSHNGLEQRSVLQHGLPQSLLSPSCHCLKWRPASRQCYLDVPCVSRFLSRGVLEKHLLRKLSLLLPVLPRVLHRCRRANAGKQHASEQSFLLYRPQRAALPKNLLPVLPLLSQLHSRLHISRLSCPGPPAPKAAPEGILRPVTPSQFQHGPS
mmetsp:Transcript_90150/g.160551  ORF Transcript_90150/g.160551 Transcript_90150/m.160551 type:complete len:203 (+) Transcript_90150:297-905(+)